MLKFTKPGGGKRVCYVGPSLTRVYFAILWSIFSRTNAAIMPYFPVAEEWQHYPVLKAFPSISPRAFGISSEKFSVIPG